MTSKEAEEIVKDSDYESIMGCKCIYCGESLPIVFKETQPKIVMGCACNNYTHKLKDTDYKFIATILEK